MNNAESYRFKAKLELQRAKECGLDEASYYTAIAQVYALLAISAACAANAGER
jgi:hypothetical protein